MSHTAHIHFGRLLKEKRIQDYGLTLRLAAKNIGMSASSLSRIENGKLVPSINVLAKLALAMRLNITISPGDIQVYRNYDK